MTDFFFIVGAQRSGTTYLCRILDEHPEIEMAKPFKPEPKFFFLDALYERGLEYYQSHFFGSKPQARLRGEKSVCYLESEKAARRIARDFPDAKILVILRNPIERAISNYFFSVNNGLETLPMEEAFLQEESRWKSFAADRSVVSPYAYLRRGRYVEFLSNYEKLLAREQIKILLFEELVGKPGALGEIYRFLGVDESFTTRDVSIPLNQSEKSDYRLSEGMLHYLQDYFSASNAALAEQYGINISPWQENPSRK